MSRISMALFIYLSIYFTFGKKANKKPVHQLMIIIQKHILPGNIQIGLEIG